MRVSHGYPFAEAGRSQSIGVHVHEERAAALPALGERADLHDLSLRANSDITVCAVVRALDDFGGDEVANLPEPRYGRSRGNHRTSAVDHNPDLALTCRDRRLIDEPEQAASLSACGQARFRRLRDVRDEVEVKTAVSAEGDGDLVLDVVEVGQEEVAVTVKRQAGVATRVFQVVVVPDQPR
ncbi:MAG: hypothetical protein ACJ8BW_19135, partial [Ktedonobacteraceae bacterium]